MFNKFIKARIHNCILSMNTKFSPKKNAMYFSNPFGITLIFTSNLLSSEKIK